MEQTTVLKITIILLLVALILIIAKVMIDKRNIQKASFLLKEVSFDDKYVQNRKNLGIKPKGMMFPLDKYVLLPFDSLPNYDPKFRWVWYERIKFMKFLKIENKIYGLYFSLITQLFKKIKDFDSELSKNFFAPRKTVIKYKNYNEGPKLSEKVKNIFKSVDEYEYLTFVETMVIIQYLYQIFMNHIDKNDEQKKILIDIYEEEEIEDIPEFLEHNWSSICSFNHARLFYEGFSSELGIKIHLFDFRSDCHLGKLNGCLTFGTNSKEAELFIVAGSKYVYYPFFKV